MIDMHCHLLPGVDDGPSTWGETMRLLNLEKKQGVKKVILTPHVREGLFETEDAVMRKRFFELMEYDRKNPLGVEIYFGCEYHRSLDMVEMLRSGGRPTLAGSRYVLVEFSHRDTFPRVRQTVYNLVAAGFYPIIAHLERYPLVSKSLSDVEELIRLGARIQLTAGAVYGKHGLALKWNCKKLIAEDMVHFIGSDAHRIGKREPDLELCRNYLMKKKGRSYARKVLEDNPEMILENRCLKYE